MSVLYTYRCPAGHGEVDVRKPMAEASREEFCTACLLERREGVRMQRVYTPPVTDCKSFGRNLWGARTPQWQWRAKNEGQEKQFRDLAREEGRKLQFGAGRTSGS